MGARHLGGRADLLRALVARHGTDARAVDASVERRLAALLDYLPGAQAPGPEEDEPQLTGPDRGRGPEAEADVPALPTQRAPLTARLFTVLGSEELAPVEVSTTRGKPLGPEDCRPRKKGEPPASPLVGRTRLWPALRRALTCPRLGEVDVAAMVRQISRGRALHRLPRGKRRNWGDELVVVIDLAHRLIPYQADYLGIMAELRRLHGRAGITLWTVLDSPEATIGVRRGWGAVRPARGAIPLPPPDTPVLILGDLGLLSAERRAAPGWAAWCRRLGEAGAPPVGWLPCSARLVPPELAGLARLHCLGEGSLRRVERGSAGLPARPQRLLEELLTRIACCVRVEPELLRSLRRMAPDTAAEPGLEGLLWGHAPVVAAGERCCELAPPFVPGYRACFARLDAATQAEVMRRVLAIHAHRGRSTESAELLIWRSHASAEALEADLELPAQEAKDWFERLATSAAEAPGDLAGYARDLFARQGGDATWLGENSPSLAVLWAATESKSIPAGLDSADIAAARRSTGRAVAHRLVQRGERLFASVRETLAKADMVIVTASETLSTGTGVPPVGNAALSIGWPVVQVTEGFEWSTSDGLERRWLPRGRSSLEVELPLPADPGATSFELVAAGRRHRIGLLARPSWALEWGRDRQGHYALAPSPQGGAVRLDWSGREGPGEVTGWPPGPRVFRCEPMRLSETMTLGADLTYGLYLDAVISGVVKRFRWIEPGEFRMGSPEDEAERDDDEGPCHVVRLTQGFWLTETACSQSLWQAVMGKNPSHFRDDPQNPVEQVSWDDVQLFLERVGEGLDGVRAELPSEAEWEYACRAGSATAFSWGEQIDPSQANYEGTYAYAGGATGENRQRTVPVKRFEPNAWGLYQMHGNVIEWCADDLRTYRDEACTDPRGAEGDAAGRAVRGGSWGSEPGWLRSACRSRGPRDGRFVYLGFRFALRSMDPEGPRQGRGAPGRRPAAAKKGKPAAKPARRKTAPPRKR